MKKLISMRIEPGLKLFIEEHAKKDHRNFSNFMVKATTNYIREKWGVDWEEVRLSYIEAVEKADNDKKS